MIHRFTNNITVLYDGDWAGIKASLRGIDMLLEEGMNIKVMLLPDGDDPDSFARKHNATEFQEYIAAHEVDFIRFKTNLLMSEASSDPYKRSEVIKDIVKSISVIPEAIVRSEYIKECSQMLHVEERILVSEVAKMKKAKEEAQAKSTVHRTGEASQAISVDTSPAPPANTQVASGVGGTNVSNSVVPNLRVGVNGSPQYSGFEDEAYYAALAAGYDSAPVDRGLDSAITDTSLAEARQGDEAPALWEHPLYSKERLIVQQLIRHGEKVMLVDEASQQQVTVSEYVASELHTDGITFATPLFADVLNELLQHLGEADFTAERYFITHANPALSRLAVDLVEEKYQLSKYHSKTQVILSDAERLSDIITHLMVDYKHSLLEIELKNTLDQLRLPEVMNDPNKCLEVMEHYKRLVEIKQHMAKHLGDRVIG